MIYQKNQKFFGPILDLIQFLSLDKNKELDLESAQKIFGYFDKSQLIDLFELILKGEETNVTKIYRKIYDQGVEPKVFINDFLELIYYFKNINSLTLDSTNFSLNDQEFTRIKDLANLVDPKVLILFWQFTISSLKELDMISNQHLSIEMFLTRLIYLSSKKLNNDVNERLNIDHFYESNKIENPSKMIDQIKNVSQEAKSKPEVQTEIESNKKISINTLNELIEVCSIKKEIKLKYELEKNVNLVKFGKNRIEISFNESLDKSFVKTLSLKLFEWTNQRWIITLSKLKGEISVKDKKENLKKILIKESLNSKIYKDVINIFPDAELIEVKPKDKIDKND